MERIRRALVWAALALGVGILLLFALPSYRQGEASIAGKTADDFALTIDGNTVTISLPDGTSQTVTDERIAQVTGSHVVFELLRPRDMTMMPRWDSAYIDVAAD